MSFPTIARTAYEAAHSGVALFDVSNRSKLVLRGKDRAAFLHNFTTNEINKLQPGQGCETFVTQHQAKVLAWLQVAVEPESLYCHMEPGLASKIQTHLEKYQITEEVTFEDRSETDAMWYVVGPAATSVLQKLSRQSLELSPFGHLRFTWNQTDVMLQRIDLLGQPGFFLILPKEKSESLYSELLALGAIPGEEQAWECLRIEANTPAYRIDFDENNLPQEINRTEVAISFTKGCYIGQETVARIRAYGHVNKMLHRVLIPIASPEDTSLSSGQALLRDGKEVGKLASFTWSIQHQQFLAFAVLRKGNWEVGLKLKLANSDWEAVVLN